MYARIANRTRDNKGTTPAIAAVGTSAQPPSNPPSGGDRTPQRKISENQTSSTLAVPSPTHHIEIASGDVNSTAGAAISRSPTRPEEDSPPQVPLVRKSKGKEIAQGRGDPKKRKLRDSKSSHSSRSSKRSKSSSKTKAKAAAKKVEEENLKLVAELTNWWNEAENSASRKIAEMQGERLAPDWSISAQSSVLRRFVGGI
ncbi:UNVERIFIED_CONTAM: hypothetical protein Sradi_4340300 [Sesamum radiatum]|uniref:Uncharacterized protein n=1 Tax=Sesamum radiatum TaxID=300843 RepID=A0AAW2NMK0_SESRA